MAGALLDLVRSKRVLIAVGAGGVGKTTTSAALAVMAAREGRHVLCLTIDPAKRLAESLGLAEMTSEAIKVDVRRFEDAGVDCPGSLTAMMLDTKKTFDELVTKHSSTPERAAHLLQNRLYQYVSTSLAGTHEYMAMEKLAQVKDDPAYDLIILDTPPTSNALDFLDAPERMTEAIDSPAMAWMVQAFTASGTFSFNLLAKGAAAVLRGVGKITGAGFLQSLSEFVSELNDLFGGFRERAKRVYAALRSDDVAFVLVTSPSAESLREVSYFADRLNEAQMRAGALVINRFHVAHKGPVPSEDKVWGAASELGLGISRAVLPKIFAAFSDWQTESRVDEANVAELAMKGVPVVKVPAFSTDVHSLRLLADLGDLLAQD